MSDRTFFDTNVIVYSLNPTDVRKAPIATAILRNAVKTNTGVLSYQVVQELINIGFRKFRPAMTSVEATTYLEEVMREFEVVSWSASLVRRAIVIRSRYLFGWYDSLIVAAALESKCDVLYTEDLQHQQRIEGLTVVNPFL
jgi:predicted nucleic acid-binding protein